MNIRQRHQALSTTVAAQLSVEDIAQGMNTLVVQNINDSGFVYLGNENVSTSDYGFKLFPGQALSIELRPYDRLYAVSSASSMEAAVMVIERAS
jgi:hypothetical protein